MYKNISKSIPAIDELTGLENLSSSKQNIHKSTVSESHNSSLTYKPSVLKPTNWTRSISMNHLTDIENNNQNSDALTMNLKMNKNNYLLKKNRNCSLTRNRLMDSDDSSDTSSQVASNKISEGLRKIDSLLQYVDQLRIYLSSTRSSEYTELAAFEACMLNWEAVLKLNRATMLEDQKINFHGSQRRSNSSGNKRITKRASMYNQHSPSGVSDELDDNVLMNSNDQVSENDSGIDSLRQHVSPYNSKSNQGQHHLPLPSNSNINYGTSGRSGSGPAQRRFRQIKERRKSLGVVLDSMSSADYEKLVLNSDKFWEINANSSVDPHVIAMASSLGSEFTQTASGNSEVDDCLRHHLKRAIKTLETFQKLNGPLEYKLTEMLCRMEQDTVALEELLNISDTLPAIPNISNCKFKINFI